MGERKESHLHRFALAKRSARTDSRTGAQRPPDGALPVDAKPADGRRWIDASAGAERRPRSGGSRHRLKGAADERMGADGGSKRRSALDAYSHLPFLLLLLLLTQPVQLE